MSQLDDDKGFWPLVRIVQAHPDGSITGATEFSLKHFGGEVPNTGDTIGIVWDSESEYEFQVVLRRYFLTEWKGRSYWVVVVREADPSPQFDAICTNALLTTDLFRAAAMNAPEKEQVARLRQLEGEPTPGIRKFKPKVREPAEPYDDDLP